MRKLIPARLRAFLRQQHRKHVFDRALRNFKKSPDPKWIPDLIYGWNNQLWSALDEYLVACIDAAQSTPGNIIECGSGLSTLLLGAVAQSKGQKMWTLEHHAAWGTRVREHLQRYGITSVTLCCAPLKDYGAFEWYDPPLASMPAQFSLAICDGPPGDSKGGRYGLVPVMGSRLRGATILLDDAGRPEEQEIARQWSQERQAEYSTLGAEKPYIRMRLDS